MQNERTTVLRDSDEKIRFFFVALCLSRQRTLVVVALVHQLEHLGVFVNHSRRSNRHISLLMTYLLLFCLFVSFASVGAWSSSRCSGSNTTAIVCSYQFLQLPISNRSVYFQVPEGPAPSNGWPFAVFFQGSFAGPSLDWSLSTRDPFNAILQIDTFWALLSAGIAVLAPAAIDDLFWETNIPPYDVLPNLWYQSDDHAMIVELLSAADNASLPFNVPLDVDNAFAFGISSGGYQSSRVAVDMPSWFRAVVVANGAYMTCGGPVCSTPRTVSPNHPPTRILYGLIDPVVPAYTSLDYLKTLQRSNVTSDAIECALCVHEWIPDSAVAVVSWFNAYRV